MKVPIAELLRRGEPVEGLHAHDLFHHVGVVVLMRLRMGEGGCCRELECRVDRGSGLGHMEPTHHLREMCGVDVDTNRGSVSWSHGLHARHGERGRGT